VNLVQIIREYSIFYASNHTTELEYSEQGSSTVSRIQMNMILEQLTIIAADNSKKMPIVYIFAIE